MNPFAIAARAFQWWWDEWVVLILLNTAWLVLQIPVITGPPATAVVYALTRRTCNGEYWGLREGGQAMKQLFGPAWRWGALNGVLFFIAFYNLLTYWQTTAVFWQFLKGLWLAAIFVWFTLNLFYWPFWLSQEEKSMAVTYANSGRFLLLHPWTALGLGLCCTAVVLITLATKLPVIVGVFCWLALVGEIAVRRSLALHHP